MINLSPRAPDIWLAAGVRTPFAKVDGPLSGFDAIALSVPVVKHMVGLLDGGKPDFAVWGNVVPNLTWSNIAREILMDAGIDPTVPAYSTIMACSTSMIGVFEAVGMIDGATRNLALVGGGDSLSRIQLGLGTSLSDWVRQFQNARSLGQKLSHAFDLKLHDVRLYIPAVSNRTTGMSMGEHTEITAKEWKISRKDQDQIALESHRNSVAAWDRGFFDDLVIPFPQAPLGRILLRRAIHANPAGAGQWADRPAEHARSEVHLPAERVALPDNFERRLGPHSK